MNLGIRLFLSITFLLVHFGNAQSVVSDVEIEQSIEKNARSFLKNKEINSVSIGIYKDGKNFIKHYGELEKGKGNPPNNESIYEIASVTKTMTGYLAAQAVIDKKIKLEDDIRTYLDGEYPNLQYENEPIRLKHLLTHTSGLPKYLPLVMSGVFEKLNEQVPWNYQEFEETFSKQDFLNDLKKVTINYTPGSKYEYSNAGAELVGFILEIVYEEDIETILSRYLFEPAGMNNSTISLEKKDQENLVQGYWIKNDELSPNHLNSFWGTGAGVKSNVPDMLKYIQFQLDENNVAVQESHIALYNRGKTAKVGYFWNLWADKYGPSLNHPGGTSGMQNWIFIYPRHNLGITIFTNHSGPKTPGKLRKVVQRILKDILPKV